MFLHTIKQFWLAIFYVCACACACACVFFWRSPFCFLEATCCDNKALSFCVSTAARIPEEEIDWGCREFCITKQGLWHVYDPGRWQTTMSGRCHPGHGPQLPSAPIPFWDGQPGGVLEANRLNSNNNNLGSPYSVPPNASPGSTPGPGGGSGGLTSNFNPNGSSATPSVEQELQEILDELTKNHDPSLPELDIEKILGKESDDQARTAGGFVHPEVIAPPKDLHRDSRTWRPTSLGPLVSLKLCPLKWGPSPPGAPYTLPHPSKPVPSPLSASPLSSSSSQGQNQARSPMLSAALSSLPGSNWHEMSRAQQLQQMASNSKHHSKNSAGPPPAQSGLSGLGQQSTSWAGPSPPYRPGDKLPNSSPHQQPFSPAGNIQSPQSSLISSMAPAPSTGPSPPYRPEKLASPAIAQPLSAPRTAFCLEMPHQEFPALQSKVLRQIIFLVLPQHQTTLDRHLLTDQINIPVQLGNANQERNLPHKDIFSTRKIIKHLQCLSCSKPSHPSPTQ